MLLREFDKSDNYLCSSDFQPMDPADRTYEKGLVLLTDFTQVSDLVLSKKTNSNVQLSFLASDPLAMQRFGSDFCPSWIRNPTSRSLFADANLLGDC
ncbi:unnamed protein product [Hymenolepis diminuta]|uniref:Uncharacterized protein n=1 Tax=Hymenolepis diminuta TaxID=6216 RepID=A0A564ZAA4_HYMDI|nr:unnamed protein product [Hymenolepis diminuta]